MLPGTAGSEPRARFRLRDCCFASEESSVNPALLVMRSAPLRFATRRLLEPTNTSATIGCTGASRRPATRTLASVRPLASAPAIASATSRWPATTASDDHNATQWEAVVRIGDVRPVMWVLGRRRADSLRHCRPVGSDRLSLCRPSPTEDRQRDLIGACQSPMEWCPPRSASSAISNEGTGT
jgi:hypothetical protein